VALKTVPVSVKFIFTSSKLIAHLFVLKIDSNECFTICQHYVRKKIQGGKTFFYSPP
jgi:hypothetical protein